MKNIDIVRFVISILIWLSFPAFTYIQIPNMGFVGIVSIIMSFGIGWWMVYRYGLLDKIVFPPISKQNIGLYFAIVLLSVYTIIPMVYYAKNSYEIDIYIVLYLITNPVNILAIIGIVTLYFYIWKNIIPNIVSFFRSFTKVEEYFFILSSIFIVFITVFIYQSTSIFSIPTAPNGDEILYDVLYTTDNGALIKQDVFREFHALENDIRQPLFGLFSYPFGLVSGIVSQLVFFFPEEAVYVFMIAICQIIALNVTIVLIGRMLHEKTKLLPMLLLSSTYSYVLFTITIEQYVFAIFWLLLAIYLVVKKDYRHPLLLTSASGTLLTSAALFPIFLKNFKVKEIMKKGFYCFFVFCLLLILVGKLDTLVYSISALEKLSQFAGGKVEFIDRVYQFTHFVSNMFVAPAYKTVLNIYGHSTYQLLQPQTFSILGIILFVCTIIGFLLNHNKTISRIAFGAVLYSLVLFVLIGWGTAENGLILYSLYFCWAYVILLYQLIETIFRKYTKLKTIVLSILIIVLIVFNFMGMMQVIGFGNLFFPSL